MAEIKTVGVIGAGQMGAGIAQVCAVAGLDVLLNDISPDRIEAGIALVRKNLSRLVAKGSMTQADLDAAIARLKPAPTPADVGVADLVIEAAVEDEEIKKTIFRPLGPPLGPNTILASNTSSISIT